MASKTYSEILKRDAPRLAHCYDDMLAARSASYDQSLCKAFDVSKDLDPEDFVLPYEALPEAWVAVGPGPAEPRPSATKLDHLRDVKRVMPFLPWWDPKRPERPGVVVAGSFATPAREGEYVGHTVTTYAFDDNGKGVELSQAINMPKRGDIDLFMVGRDADLAELFIRRALSNDESNPFAPLQPINVCSKCQRHSRLTRWNHGALKCERCVPCADTHIYDYAAKHVIGFSLCVDAPENIKVQLVTRMYESPMRVPALFDLTYDGGVFDGDVVRYLDISRYQIARGIMLWTPFSGSSTQELRAVKKIVGYGIPLVVPGHTMTDRDDNARGLTVVRDAVPLARLLAELRGEPQDDIVNAVRDIRARSNSLSKFYVHLVRKGVKTYKGVVNALIDSVGIESPYSFVPGCNGVRVSAGADSWVIFLYDKPGSDKHVGAFSFRDPETFALDMCLPVPETLPALNGMVDGCSDPRAVKRVSKAFGSEYVRNLVTSFDMKAVLKATAVAMAPGSEPSELIVAIEFEFEGVMGAQIWRLDCSGIGAPVLRCTTDTGLYHTGQAVCMGMHSHFHPDLKIAFSLSSAVSCIAERPELIKAGDTEHINSVGVAFDDFGDHAALHQAGLSAVREREWAVTWKLAEA